MKKWIRDAIIGTLVVLAIPLLIYSYAHGGQWLNPTEWWQYQCLTPPHTCWAEIVENPDTGQQEVRYPTCYGTVWVGKRVRFCS